MSIYEKRLKFALNEVARKLELKSFRFEYRGLDKTLDNYFGVMVPITLIGENNDGEIFRQLIAKIPPNDKDLREAGLLEFVYEIESFFYVTLLPRYKSLSRVDLSELFAECYHADTTRFEEVIILKDMHEEGFRRYEGSSFLDFDHVVVSLHSLALFHALSIVLRNKTNNIDKKNLLHAFSSSFPYEFMKTLKNSLINNLYIFKETKYAAFFNKLIANFDDVVNESVHNAICLVYGHGDFWKENIMFKYEDNKPMIACVLDFQTIHLLSPAQDVLCFLLTSTDAETRRKYYNFFLETYYRRFRHILLEHSLDPNSIYSRNDFYWDLKTVAPYCFVTTNMSFSLWLGLERDSLLKSKHICEEENENNAAIASYKQTMMEIADDFVAFGYYNA